MTKPLLPPFPLEGPSIWVGAQIENSVDEWLTVLTNYELNELQTATHTFMESGTDIGSLSPENFPLPTLGAKLEKLRKELISGRGFEVIRGLPVNTYTTQQAAIMFCGIGTYIGNARSQNAMGHILGHVRDVGADANDPNSRIYQTSERQTFHTDSADVVGLLCLKEAKEGGDSLLVSTGTIYNKMCETRPDLAVLLFDPIATDRRGEIPEGQKPYFEIPVFSWYEGYLTGMYQRQYIDSAQRFEGVMKLSDKHIEALNIFDELANDPTLHIRMRLQPGDLQFVHNHSLLHDRTGFLDWPEKEKRRHLLRLWLSVEGDRPLPQCFKQRFGTIEIGNRGGIITKDTVPTVPL